MRTAFVWEPIGHFRFAEFESSTFPPTARTIGAAGKGRLLVADSCATSKRPERHGSAPGLNFNTVE